MGNGARQPEAVDEFQVLHDRTRDLERRIEELTAELAAIRAELHAGKPEAAPKPPPPSAPIVLHSLEFWTVAEED